MHIKKKKRSQNKIRLARESAPSARRLSSLAPLESSLYQLSNGTKRDSWSARGAPSSPIRNAEKHWKNTKNHAFLQKVSLGFLHHENCRDLNFHTFKPTHILPFISWYYNAPEHWLTHTFASNAAILEVCSTSSSFEIILSHTYSVIFKPWKVSL